MTTIPSTSTAGVARRAPLGQTGDDILVARAEQSRHRGQRVGVGADEDARLALLDPLQDHPGGALGCRAGDPLELRGEVTVDLARGTLADPGVAHDVGPDPARVNGVHL